MTRPIGPMERLAIDAANKVRAAREALQTLHEELMEHDPRGCEQMRRALDSAFSHPCIAVGEPHIVLAREADAAAKTWLEWEWDKSGRVWRARYADIFYSVVYRRKRRDPSVWGVVVPVALQQTRFNSPEEAKRACEDHARQRGQFARKETT